MRLNLFNAIHAIMPSASFHTGGVINLLGGWSCRSFDFAQDDTAGSLRMTISLSVSDFAEEFDADESYFQLVVVIFKVFHGCFK